VKEASIQECREVTELRLHIAALVGQLIVRRSTPEDIRGFRTLLADIRDSEDSQALRTHDIQFHNLVDAAAHNPSLVILQRQLGNQFARIRNTLDPAIDNTHFAGLREDLKALIEGLVDKDGELCSSVLREHLMRFARQVLTSEW